MNTSEIFKKKTTFSFEVFPPKKTSPIETIYKTLDELKNLKPDFISVTFGAGGSENSDTTLSIANRIKTVCGVESVVHLPCIHLTKEKVTNLLTDFRAAGIENILALRGDKVEGKEPCSDFLHASDLIKFIKDFFIKSLKLSANRSFVSSSNSLGLFKARHLYTLSSYWESILENLLLSPSFFSR